MLYDSLFGLVLFFSLDAFLDITEPAHFLFYLFSTAVLVHWWMMFKAAEDLFGTEVRETAGHLVFNIGIILLLEFMILNARSGAFIAAAWYLIAALAADLAWAALTLGFHRWKMRDRRRLAAARQELRYIVLTDAVAIALFGALLWLAAALALPALAFVLGFVTIYLLFIGLSFRFQIIDLKMF